MSTKNHPMQDLLVYLLCFDPAPDTREHYVGITTPERLYARMGEHRCGRGALQTRRLMEQGRGFTLARLWPTQKPELEAELINFAHKETLCPICSGEPTQIYYGPRLVLDPWTDDKPKFDFESIAPLDRPLT